MVARRVISILDGMPQGKRPNRSEIARGIGLTQPQVSQFLNEKRGISWEALDRLAPVLGVPREYLFVDPLRAASLSAEDQALLAAYHQAYDRTRRAVATLLELPDATSSPTAALSDVNTIAEAIVRAAADLTSGRRIDLSRPGADRRPQPGTSHRTAPGRRS
ncbi:MAG: helix-turn-helix domain-containing protein [Vicinamibacterales bacterium]